MAPIIDEMKLGMLLPISLKLLTIGNPTKVPMNPPTIAPTIPKIIVNTTPPPSGPGITNFAM